HCNLRTEPDHRLDFHGARPGIPAEAGRHDDSRQRCAHSAAVCFAAAGERTASRDANSWRGTHISDVERWAGVECGRNSALSVSSDSHFIASLANPVTAQLTA